MKFTSGVIVLMSLTAEIKVLKGVFNSGRKEVLIVKRFLL